jgi:hypothetical protein
VNLIFLVVIKDGLKSNFADVQVDIVDCPDLSQAPYHLASEGEPVKFRILNFAYLNL